MLDRRKMDKNRVERIFAHRSTRKSFLIFVVKFNSYVQRITYIILVSTRIRTGNYVRSRNDAIDRLYLLKEIERFE